MKGGLVLAARLFAVAILCLAGAAAVVVWQRDARARRAVDDLARRYHIDARRPAEYETLPLAPSADFAADVLGDAAIDDALGSISLRDLEPSVRQMWMESRLSLDPELRDARESVLTGATFRPAWTYHWNLVGRIEYVAARRAFLADDATRARWESAFDSALFNAPADRATSAFYAGAFLESWGTLSPREKDRFFEILPSAMRDPAFLGMNVAAMTKLIGRDVLRLVPSDPASLDLTMQAFAKAGDVAEVAALLPKWERAERRARQADLAQLRHLRDRYDVEALRGACSLWARNHPPGEFDDPESLRQLDELLRLWPGGERGNWESDPRAAILEYALTGRTAYFTPSAVARTAEELSGVPAPVRAEIYALAGDEDAAEELMKKGDTAGSFEWTPVVVALARNELKRNRPDLAYGWLAQLSSSAADECEPRILRSILSKSPPAPEDFARSSDQFTKKKSTVVCVDRRFDNAAALEAVLWSDAPALVDVGWDGGRAATVMLRDSAVALRLPLAGKDGLHSLSAATRAGGSVAWRLRRIGTR